MSPPPPVRGPLAAVTVGAEALRGRPGVSLLYADLDLAERDALRRALDLPHGADDDALLLAAYRAWGIDAADRLGGQFAAALWDGDRQAVVAMCDPIGLRPLVYAEVPGGLVVGGDLDAVLDADGVDDALDEGMLAALLLDRSYVYPEALGRTCYRAVRALPGGHTLTATAGGLSVHRYWRPEEAPRLPLRRLDEIGEALRALLREVVAEAVADVPAEALGLHLSGGLDSSVVAALAAEARGPMPGFAWQRRPGPGEPRLAEHDKIEAIAAHLSVPVAWCPATADDFAELGRLDATRDPVEMWALEAPVRREASAAGVRVLLSGWGGDEAISSNGRGLTSAALARQGRWGVLAASALRDPVHALRRLAFLARGGRPQPPTLEALREAALRGDHPSFARRDLLRRAALPEVPPAPRDPRAYMAWFLRLGHLSRRTRAWARAGAPHGLQYRYPLLDRRVVAFALGLPEEVWLTHRRQTRWPLRMASEGLVPDAVRLTGKDEPARVAASFEALREATARLAPLVTPEVAGPRAELFDIAALQQALAEGGGEMPAYGQRLHATSYLPRLSS